MKGQCSKKKVDCGNKSLLDGHLSSVRVDPVMSLEKGLECFPALQRRPYSILNTLLMAEATSFFNASLRTTFNFACFGLAGEGTSQLKLVSGSATVPAAFFHSPLVPKV